MLVSNTTSPTTLPDRLLQLNGTEFCLRLIIVGVLTGPCSSKQTLTIAYGNTAYNKPVRPLGSKLYEQASSRRAQSSLLHLEQVHTRMASHAFLSALDIHRQRPLIASIAS